MTHHVAMCINTLNKQNILSLPAGTLLKVTEELMNSFVPSRLLCLCLRSGTLFKSEGKGLSGLLGLVRNVFSECCKFILKCSKFIDLMAVSIRRVCV